jgi:hypothetical protein
VSQADSLLHGLRPVGAAALQRRHLALELVEDVVRIDEQLRASRQRIDADVVASGTTRLSPSLLK